MTLEEEAHIALGKVVANSQLFEFAFITCAKLALTQETAGTLSEVRPLSMATSFRQPVASALKELSSRINLNPQFESLVTEATEHRHYLIHRWFVSRGWPAATDEAGLQTLRDSAVVLNTKLMSLTVLLIQAVFAWLERFPEVRASIPASIADWDSLLRHLPPGTTIRQ